MPITVRIEDERGKAQGEEWWHADSTALLVGDHPGTCCLRFIDPYGDTVFNQAQLPVLLAELRQLQGQLSDPRQASALTELSHFLDRALDRPHVYVRFLGD